MVCAVLSLFSASPGAAVALIALNVSGCSAIAGTAGSYRRSSSIEREMSVNSVEVSHYLAAAIPGADLAELPGDDRVPWLGDQDALIEAVRVFFIQRLGSNDLTQVGA